MSYLSKCTDRITSDEHPKSFSSIPKSFLGDEICTVEQYLVDMRLDHVPTEAVILLRLASFVYVARYIRMLPRKSRIHEQLLSKMQETICAAAIMFPSATASFDLHKHLFFCLAIACATSSNELIKSTIAHERDTYKFWLGQLRLISRRLRIIAVPEAMGCLDRIMYVTRKCRNDAERAFEACGLRIHPETEL